MKPWHEMLGDFLAGLLTKDRLAAAGASQDALRGAITEKIGLGSGYSVDAERQAKAAQLRQLCHEAVENPAWQPSPDGRTYCNRAVNVICQGMGYFGFLPERLANDMIRLMEYGNGWRVEHDLGRVAPLALRGVLVVFGLKEEPHGHVCVAYPGPPRPSGTWGREVPQVSNVGKHNGIMPLSQAFRKDQMPTAFVLEESEV